MTQPVTVLDCTLRDGGYYNDWNFSRDLVVQYLDSMPAAGIDAVEVGFRSLVNTSFKGPCAFTTDSYLRSLPLPRGCTIAVMVNASELMAADELTEALERLFPEDRADSPVDLVRIACHVHELEAALPASRWLAERGFRIAFNLMQTSERTRAEVECLARRASDFPVDVLYLADSLGSMKPADTAAVIGWLRTHWQGEIGVHTHDSLGLALQNTLTALDEGACWADATVTGMGRGPGNTRTEQLVVEAAERRSTPLNLVPLMNVIRDHLEPLQRQHGWGTNTYYYLAGKHGIHPTYIQQMLADSRYTEEDMLTVIEHLRVEGAKKFSANKLDTD